MRLKKRLETFSSYSNPAPVIEEVQIDAINEKGVQDFVDTMGSPGSGYETGKAYGAAFTAAVIGGVVLMIAIKRAQARLEKKKGLYKKMAPKLFTLEADKRLIPKRAAFKKDEQLEKLIGGKSKKIKSKFSAKKAQYAANANKNQEDLERERDTGFAKLVADETAALKKLTDAATEKLKRVTNEETLTIDRKIQDWNAKWKKVEEKLDPSSLFDGISGGKGLGGVKAKWDEWKIQADRKLSDAALKYEFKQYDEYIENDEDLKAIKNRRMESHQKFIEELDKKTKSVEARLKKLQSEEEDIQKETGEVGKDEKANDAGNFHTIYLEARDDWKFAVDSIAQTKGHNKEDDSKVSTAKKECLQAYKQMTKDNYEAMAKNPKAANTLKELDVKENDVIEQKWVDFQKAVKEDIKEIEKEIEAEEVKKSGVSVKKKKEQDAEIEEYDAEIKGFEDAIKRLEGERDAAAAISPDIAAEKDKEIATQMGNLETAKAGKKELMAKLPKADKGVIAKADYEIAIRNLKIAKLKKDGIDAAEKEIEKAQAAIDALAPKKESLEIKDEYIILEKKNKLINMKKLISLNEWVLLKENGPSPAEQPSQDVSTTDTGKEQTDLSTEIDSILDKLKDLENGLDESADQLLMEGPVSFIKDYMRSGKVKGLQTKANGLKKKKAKMEVAKANSDDPAKKEKITTQLDGIGDMIKSTEGEIDDLADSAGPFSGKVKSTLRAKGNLEVIKIKLKGGKASDTDKKRVKELQAKLAKSQQELKDMATKNQEAITKAKKDGKGYNESEFDGSGRNLPITE